MDGSHGMAGVQGVFSGLALAWLFHRSGANGMSLVSVMIAASCLGFLPWNLTSKRVFMGDVASVPLGFVFAGLTVYGVALGMFSGAVALLVLAVFLVDASMTLLVRVLKGERWYTAHRQHLYQQLIASGWSHESVLALYLSINIVLVLPAIVVSVRNPESTWFVTLGLIAMMIVGWTLATRRLGVVP
jgi:Fuc2NAc and GlcNAc transferase